MQRGPPTVPSRVHRNPTQDLRPRNHPLIHELCAPQPHRPRLRPPIFSVSSIQCSLRARGARRTSRKHGRKGGASWKGSSSSSSLGEVWRRGCHRLCLIRFAPSATFSLSLSVNRERDRRLEISSQSCILCLRLRIIDNLLILKCQIYTFALKKNNKRGKLISRRLWKINTWIEDKIRFWKWRRRIFRDYKLEKLKKWSPLETNENFHFLLFSPTA